MGKVEERERQTAKLPLALHTSPDLGRHSSTSQSSILAHCTPLDFFPSSPPSSPSPSFPHLQTAMAPAPADLNTLLALAVDEQKALYALAELYSDLRRLEGQRVAK